MLNLIRSALLGALATAAYDEVLRRAEFNVDWFLVFQQLQTASIMAYGSRTLLDGEDTYRVNGDVTCAICGKLYRKHPFSDDRDWNGDPWLNLGCDGRKLKL